MDEVYGKNVVAEPAELATNIADSNAGNTLARQHASPLPCCEAGSAHGR